MMQMAAKQAHKPGNRPAPPSACWKQPAWLTRPARGQPCRCL